MGRPRAFDTPHLVDIRSWSIREFPSVLIFYRPSGHGIEVIRVLHGARDIEAILEAET
jgi:toxin ParE1/3/4